MRFISDEIDSAVKLQLDYEGRGGQFYDDQALTHFGRALHTVVDRASRQHAGYQPWYGAANGLPESLKHAGTEMWSATSGTSKDAEARNEAYVQAQRLYQEYQSRLAAERKKKKENEEKEKKQ
jgi:hypothetical protein